MTAKQAEIVRDLAASIAVFEGYEKSKIAAVNQRDGDQDGDTILLINGEVGDVPVRIKPDGTMFDVLRRKVSTNEVLQQVKSGVQVNA